MLSHGSIQQSVMSMLESHGTSRRPEASFRLTLVVLEVAACSTTGSAPVSHQSQSSGSGAMTSARSSSSRIRDAGSGSGSTAGATADAAASGGSGLGSADAASLLDADAADADAAVDAGDACHPGTFSGQLCCDVSPNVPQGTTCPTGSACATNANCASGLCSKGSCAVGGPCDAGAACDSGQCFEGNCVPSGCSQSGGQSACQTIIAPCSCASACGTGSYTFSCDYDEFGYEVFCCPLPQDGGT